MSIYALNNDYYDEAERFVFTEIIVLQIFVVSLACINLSQSFSGQSCGGGDSGQKT